ncbi:hypothetical protein RJ640_008587 [Escallonia rubra]|uniref:Pentatricopeptide repeat-containing protein n=1 Tax=Escallonia rubra TaxID=112253 RepID=A0AA88QJS2_9ASTE|nr:hypothetical protein RJ640_008587 [Escallonia rubra]
MASSLRSNLTFLPPPPPRPSIKDQPVNHTKIHIPTRCGPRDKRGPLVKGRVLSIEAIQAVQALKRADRADQSKLDDLLSKSIPRLIKSDLIAAFNELLRQDQCYLALRVFSAVRSEIWYKTNLSLYADLVSALARKGLTEDIDRLIGELDAVSFDDDGKGLLRLVKALIAAGRGESTVRIYGMMRSSGWGATCAADDYVAKVLSRGLRRLGQASVADEIDREFGGSSKGNLEKTRV